MHGWVLELREQLNPSGKLPVTDAAPALISSYEAAGICIQSAITTFPSFPSVALHQLEALSH